MSGFPRTSHMSLIGLAGIGALLLIPGDDTPRVSGLTLGSAPAGAVADVAVPDRTMGPAETSAVLSSQDTVPPPVAVESPATAIASVDAAGPAAVPDPAVTETTSKTVWVGPSAANVRVGPSVSTARLFVLRPGEKVSATETSGKWTLVTTATGDSGWVAASLLSDSATPAATPRKPKPPAQARQRQYQLVGNPVTLRAGPSRLSPRIFVLSPGDKVSVVETRGRWVRVVLESGVSAWVDGRDL